MANARINIERFSGRIPRLGNRMLPPNNASVAENVRLRSGELRGLRNLGYLTTVDGARRVYRLPNENAPSGVTWTGFPSIDTSLYRGPLLNDEFDRYYKFGDGPPQYNTLNRIENGDPYFLLGVPAPVGDGVVTPAGGTEADVTRFYVYTFVSAYGEEGPPSDPVSATGPSDAVWTYSGLDTTVPDETQRNITAKNIYRTVTGDATAEFYFVAEIPLATDSYADSSADTEIVQNNILQSEDWFPPPDDIEDVVVMPNGFFLGWSGRDVHFCEPYRPHAWPPAYDQSVEFDIVGGGVFGQSAGLVTEGSPYIGTGVSPASVTLGKTGTVAPGLSRHGVTTLPYGVIYPNQNGLMLLGPNGAELVTKDIITEDIWQRDYSPSTMIAAQYQSAYVGFFADSSGVLIDPADVMATFSDLTQYRNVDFIQTDPFTGDVFVVSSGDVYLWDDITTDRVFYTWRSKTYSFAKPCNLGAVHIDTFGEVASDVDEEAINAAREWNLARLTAAPLDMLGYYPLGSSTQVPLTPELEAFRAQYSQPFAGSPLIDVSGRLNAGQSVRLNVYANDELVYSELWQGQYCIRLPSGFKAEDWAFEIIARRSIFSISVAETCKGLADV